MHAENKIPPSCSLSPSFSCIHFISLTENWCTGDRGVLRFDLWHFQELWVRIHPVLSVQRMKEQRGDKWRAEEDHEKRSKGTVYVKMTSARFLFLILLLFLISYLGSPAETVCQKLSLTLFANMTFPRSPILPNLAALWGNKSHLQIWPSSQSPASERHFINKTTISNTKATQWKNRNIYNYNTCENLKESKSYKRSNESWYSSKSHCFWLVSASHPGYLKPGRGFLSLDPWLKIPGFTSNVLYCDAHPSVLIRTTLTQ